MTTSKDESPIDYSQYIVKRKGASVDQEPKEPEIDYSQYIVKDKSKAKPKINAEAKEATGLTGVGTDIMDLFMNALTGAANLPDTAGKARDFIAENPATAMKHYLAQLGAGGADVLKGLANSGADVNEYLQKKRLHPAQLFTGGESEGGEEIVNSPKQIAEGIAKNIGSPYKQFATELINSITKNLPRIPEDTGAEKFFGNEPIPESGDTLFRGLVPTVAAIAPLALGVKSIAKVAKEASKETKFIRAFEKRIDQAADKVGMSEEALKGFKESLRREYSKAHGESIGEVTPIGQEVAANIKTHKVEKLKPDTEIPEEHVGEIPEAPDTEKMLVEHEDAIEAAKKATNEHLGTMENPSITAGGKIKKAIKALHNSSSNLYKSARKFYEDKKIVADNSKEIKAVTNDLEELKNADELAPGYGSGTAEQKILESKLNALKGEKVNASDIFDLQESLETMAENFRNKQYATDTAAKKTTQLERNRFGEIADKLDAHAESLKSRLESVGGKEVQSIIKEANKGWKTYKDLSKRNPVGKAALKGDIPSNSMIKLAAEHDGNEFLNGMLASDPELKKNFLAAFTGTGKSNLEKLLNPTRVTRQYLESLPEVEEHVNALQNAIKKYEGKKGEVSNIKKEHKALVDSMKEAAERQKVRQNAIQESEKLKRQIKFHEDAIPKLEEKIKTVAEDTAEHNRLQKELKEHKQHLQDKNHLLKKYGAIALRATGISALMHKVGL